MSSEFDDIRQQKKVERIRDMLLNPLEVWRCSHPPTDMINLSFRKLSSWAFEVIPLLGESISNPYQA